MNDDDRFDIFDQALETALRARVAMAEVNATRWVRCPDNGCQVHAGHLDGYARTDDGQLIVEHQGDGMNPLQRMRLAESPLKAARYDGDADGHPHVDIDDENDPRFVPKDLRGRAPHSNPTDIAYAQNGKARADIRKLDRLIGQLHTIGDQITDLMAEYGPARPATDYDRRILAQANIKPEPGCSSCERFDRWAARDSGELCGSCYRWRKDFGDLPSGEYIQALEEGKTMVTKRLRSDAARRIGAA